MGCGLEYRDREFSVRNTMQRESVMRVVQAGYASAYSCWKESFDFPSFRSIDSTWFVDIGGGFRPLRGATGPACLISWLRRKLHDSTTDAGWSENASEAGREPAVVIVAGHRLYLFAELLLCPYQYISYIDSPRWRT